MTILLDPPRPDSPSFEIDHQIAVALAALHKSFVKIRGAGRFGMSRATVLMQRDADRQIALKALEQAGIRAKIKA
jgi:hypothetical protein